MMDIIKELCAFLPMVNGRWVWDQLKMRDYLSIRMWKQIEKRPGPNGAYYSFFLGTVNKDEWPGVFEVRTNWEATKVIGIYFSYPSTLNEEMAKKQALLFDLTFTPDIQAYLREMSEMNYPDAGSW